MDIRRVVMYGALILLSYFLWMDWQADYPAQPMNSQVAQSGPSAQNMLPSLNEPAHSDANIPVETTTANTSEQIGQRIYVKTDVLSLAIDLQQGDIVQAQLLQYPQTADAQSKPFVLLQDNPAMQYTAQSNLVMVKDQKVVPVDVVYSTPQKSYELRPGQETLVVALTGVSANGLKITKQFTFKRNSYLIDMNYQIQNANSQSWTGYLNTQFLRSSPQEDKTSMLHMGSFTGASYSVPGQHRYRKLSFKDMSKTNLDVESTGGWIAMQQHYFVSAWIPNAQTTQRFYTRAADQNFTIGQVSAPIVTPADATKSIAAQLYLGPEITDQLKKIAPGLDLTVDYGWLWFISQVLFSVMKSIYSVVGNWGWSIILVTLLIKLVFYRLQAASFKSMANMRRLQPKILSLRERYGDDKAKISQETMQLYRQEKVNPLGGCLPILVQIPVFIALYWVLIESVQLRHAPFVFWITDLSAADPYHILPVIMGLTMLIQQKLNPAPPDPMQAKMMMFLPVVFTIMFLNFPSGLVLYWIVNNSLSILQQWYITRKFGNAAPAKKARQ